MAHRIDLPAVPPEMMDDFPPHIRNHIADITGSSSRGAQSGSDSNDTGGISGRSASDGVSQPSSTSPFLDFLKLPTRIKDNSDKPKRRGPKPDSKPALTRKQELNRQAQRTHRERKERYVKGLEEDVARLREAFTIITKEKTAILQENRRLKELLELHGIVYNPDEDPGYGMGQYPRQNLNAGQLPPQLPPPQSYDEIGLSFVLTLEKPCMDHMVPLATNSAVNADADFHGHALMISCPPEGYSINQPNMSWDVKSLDLPVTDLSLLFNLSNRLQLSGEMTPIAVWATIARHERFADLSLEDFAQVQEWLLGKVKCHGFGAVIEEADVSDALSRLFAKKLGSLF